MSTYRPFVVLSPMHKALRRIDMYLERHFQPMGYSIREAHLLGYLINNSPSQVNKLIEVFGLKNSTLTSMITRLENKQLLVRKIHPEDKRSFEISLTSKGRVVAQKLYKITRALEDQILENLAEIDLKHLNKIVHEIETTCNQKNTDNGL